MPKAAMRGVHLHAVDATQFVKELRGMHWRPMRAPERRAIGYVCVAREASTSELAAHSEVIKAWAARNGVTVTSIVHDIEPHAADVGARPALRGALQRIAGREADTLVTAKLAHLSPTVSNLPPLLEWFAAPPRTLVAIEPRLDTATEEGRLAGVALTDLGRWEHERLSARTVRGLEAARARGSGRGPASVADVPGLRERIQRMREQGMTLRAIAEALNDAGVPTLRGGAKWRPSSVQRAAGYRRPVSRQPSIDLLGSSPVGENEGPAPAEAARRTACPAAASRLARGQVAVHGGSSFAPRGR